MAGRRKPTAAEQAPADEWNRREPEADEHSGQDDHQEAEDEAREGDDQDDAEDQDEGEGDSPPGEADDTDAAADFAAMSNVDHDAVSEDDDLGPAADFAAAMRQGPSDGIALGDPAEGGHPPAPAAVAQNANTTASVATVRQTPAPQLSSLDAHARSAMTKLEKASQDAHLRGRADGHGWLDLSQLGVPKSVMDALERAGAVDKSHRPGGEFSPNTGTVYRIVGHDKAA